MIRTITLTSEVLDRLNVRSAPLNDVASAVPAVPGVWETQDLSVQGVSHAHDEALRGSLVEVAEQKAADSRAQGHRNDRRCDQRRMRFKHSGTAC